MKVVKATVGCVIEKEEKILLTLRNIEPFNNYWSLPGGHIDFGETPKEAVIREIKEETNLNIKPKFLNYFNEFHEELDWHAAVLVFYAKAEGEAKKDEKEVKELGWFSEEQIFGLKMAFEHKKVLEEYFKKRRYLL